MQWYLRYKDTILFKIFVVTFLAWLVSMSIGIFIALKTEREMSSSNENILLANANMVKSMLQAIHLTMTHNINRITDRLIEHTTGTFDLDETKAVRIGDLDTPELRLNGKAINLNFDLVDRLTRETGAVATIFARKGDDFVRITTSLKKEDNKTRAIGTMLGKEHPGYKNMISGQDYIGKAVLFGRDYMTKYVPIKKDGKVIGILFTGIDFTNEMKEVIRSIKDMRIGESGKVFIVDGGDKTFGRVLVHNTLEAKNIHETKTPDGGVIVDKESLRDIISKGEGKFYYSWIDEGNRVEKRIVVFSLFKQWKWGIAVDVLVDELNRDSFKVKWLLIASMWLMNIIVTVTVIAALYKNVSKPAKMILDSINKVSEGDLTITSTVSSRDEMGKLSEGFNNMISSLRAIIKNILEAADSATKMVEVLKQNASNTAGQVRVQTQQANAISDSSAEMSKTINEIAANAEDASSRASNSVDTAGNGLSIAQQAISTITKVNESTIELARIVHSLERRSTEISDIVTVIKDIADQTNLLALNAAIEAARAGEQGRGFAVVADEVRKLAEKTIHATTEISSKIGSIQEEVQRTKSSMETASSEVGSATGLIDKVGNALNEIVRSIEDSKEQMTRIAAAVVEQSATTEEVAKNINATASISEEVEAMAANTMQQADRLLLIMERLKETTSGFKT